MPQEKMTWLQWQRRQAIKQLERNRLKRKAKRQRKAMKIEFDDERIAMLRARLIALEKAV